MPHLKEVIDRITVIGSTKQITQAMKMVSVSKLYKAQQRLSALKAYMMACNSLLEATLVGRDGMRLLNPFPLKQQAGVQRLLLIVVTSDRGLCGAFNKNVLRTATQYIEPYSKHTSVEVLVIGKKAYQFFKKYKWPVIDRYMAISSSIQMKESESLADYCITGFEKDYYHKVVLIYNSFKNASQQEVVVESLLPFIPDRWMAQPMVPAHHYLYEPDQQILMHKLMIRLLKHKVMTILVDSHTAEHAARVMTMGKASDNADDLLTTLRTSYNRSRQALITNAIAEITSGAEALRG
ncbi:MAG: ATP synthase F1 subunit gamma [Amoebophilaceae bacterium]|nr:ATP synthase F1 subunit gamma [Amoebophilaceae bacterium]